MSLILDALRKSEAERRRGEAPGLFSALPTPGARVVPRRSNRPAWIASVLVALAVLAAVAWWYLAPATTAPTDVTRPSVPAATITPATPATPTPPPVVVAALPKPAPTPDVKQPPEETPVAVAPASAPADASPDAEPPLESLPTLATLDPAERAGLPPLKLSMHVWSEAPNARLAIIDGQRVMEGSSIGESIVAEIRRDGVVLELHGRRYLLPRP
jgi:general secretion pathway protein B